MLQYVVLLTVPFKVLLNVEVSIIGEVVVFAKVDIVDQEVELNVTLGLVLLKSEVVKSSIVTSFIGLEVLSEKSEVVLQSLFRLGLRFFWPFFFPFRDDEFVPFFNNR